MSSGTVILALTLAAAVAGCKSSDSEKNRNESAPVAARAPAPPEAPLPPPPATEAADIPVFINGAYLSLECAPRSVDFDSGLYVIGCDLIDKDLGKVSPARVAAEYGWSTTGAESLAVEVEVAATLDPAQPTVTFRFGKGQPALVSEIVDVKLHFDYVDPTTSSQRSISRRITEILRGLEDQKYFRVVVRSIRGHDATKPVRTMQKIEFKVDGAWEALTYATTADAPAAATSGIWMPGNAQAADLDMFDNIFGIITPPLLPVAFPRFAATPPHDAVGEPLHLEYYATKPISITGIRYDGGIPLGDANVVTGFPDAIHLEVSSDAKTWRLVPGSKVDLDANAGDGVAAFFWNGYE